MTTTSGNFQRYIALGDSISIGSYPARDLNERGIQIPEQRLAGAPAQLFQNDSGLSPEFTGRDLITRSPGVKFNSLHDGTCGIAGSDDLTADKATTRELRKQIAGVTASDEPTLVTITIGGNDLLTQIGIRGAGPIGEGGNPVKGIVSRLEECLESLLKKRAAATVLLSTVYDPSDGTNRLPHNGGWLELSAESVWLREYNNEIRRIVSGEPRLRLADIHQHFLGHGLTEPDELERWYWSGLIIEPSARGASEVRRVWLEALKL